MPKRDSFLLRIDPAVLAAIRRWADDDLRSVNGQMEYLLRKALSDAGRQSKNTTQQKQSPAKPSNPRKGSSK